MKLASPNSWNSRVDLKTTVTIPYDQVEQVRKNYGAWGQAASGSVQRKI
jgi:hypothetical protein